MAKIKRYFAGGVDCGDFFVPQKIQECLLYCVLGIFFLSGAPSGTISAPSSVPQRCPPGLLR